MRTPVRTLLPGLALLYAAGGMMVGLPLAFRYQLRQGEGLNLPPSMSWPAPYVASEPGLERGPVMVTVGYRIDPARAAGFERAMGEVELKRRRDGAFFWGLFVDAAEPVRCVEFFTVESWVEHLSFPSRALEDFNPFLLLDELGPAALGPGEAKGAPDHPHRGFETATYVLEGRLQHQDSQGHAGLLGPGDVQWMTTGAGVVHSEMPEAAFARTGGRMHGFQVWVNLPRRDKMMRPHYQEIPSAQIPTATRADGAVTVNVIAGEALGARAVIDTRRPITFLHFTLQPGATWVQPLARDYQAFVAGGAGRFGFDARPARPRQMVAFANDGEGVVLVAPVDAPEPLSVLLIAGLPLHEPVVRYGPFVMNTEAEIRQALLDYQSGRMGAIAV